MVRLVSAQIYLEDGNYKEALKLVHDGDTLEMMALCVNIYLAMNRIDLAEKQLKAMQEFDDDDTETQLCLAWVTFFPCCTTRKIRKFACFLKFVECVATLTSGVSGSRW